MNEQCVPLSAHKGRAGLAAESDGMVMDHSRTEELLDISMHDRDLWDSPSSGCTRPPLARRVPKPPTVPP